MKSKITAGVVGPPRQKIAYGYCRVSTERQARQGMSLEQQQQTILAYFEYKLKPMGYIWGGFFLDPATSGKIPILSRKAGFELSLRLEAEDCVVFAKLDRGFRNLKDMIQTLEVWDSRGVKVHMLDIGVDTTTDIGRLILNILGAVAQFERQRLGERIREAYAIRRDQGKTMGRAPRGSKYLRFKNQKGAGVKLVRDDHERRVMSLIVEYRQKGWSWDGIYFEFLKKKIRNAHGREYGLTNIRKMYVAEIGLRAKEAKKDEEKETP